MCVFIGIKAKLLHKFVQRLDLEGGYKKAFIALLKTMYVSLEYLQTRAQTDTVKEIDVQAPGQYTCLHNLYKMYSHREEQSRFWYLFVSFVLRFTLFLFLRI